MEVLVPFKGYRFNKNVISKLKKIDHKTLNKLKIENNKLCDVNGSISDYINSVPEDIQLIYSEKLEKDKCSFYLCEFKNRNNGISKKGILGCINMEHYISGRIKKHENLRIEKIEDMVKKIDLYNSETAPIFLIHKHIDELYKILNIVRNNSKCIYRIRNKNDDLYIWKIEKEEHIKKIQNMMKKVDKFYIADGHHRIYSKSLYGKEDTILSFIMSDKDVEILDYNRVVKDLNRLGTKDIIKKILKNFQLINKSNNIIYPKEKGEIGVYLNKEWYLFKIKKDILNRIDKIEDNLDVSILQNLILNPIFNIKDCTRDEKLEFIGGKDRYTLIVQAVDKYDGIGFILYPTEREEFFEIIDNNMIMPPKSTWFEPKIPAGLVIHKYR
ncbi:MULTISPECIES: DUF1015 family protein [unclassified Clostridium]|uniref:DUF1015 family protein n=1 Tax=unclassified Clostridium TaxID=2614128 RepID=UPI0025BD191F|nr:MULTISPECIES: DUF1015 family protein [unclassified Clostridium]